MKFTQEARIVKAALQDLPGLLPFVRSFFSDRFNPEILQIYGDKLEEEGFQEAADFFHGLTEIQNPKKKRGRWNGRLIVPFYTIFGQPGGSKIFLEFGSRNVWFLIDYQFSRRMARPTILPGGTSYVLSLTNGKWLSYHNDTERTVCVVSTRHQPTEESEQWYPQNRISLRDYTPLNVNDVPQDILFYAFYKIIEHHVRGEM